MEIDGHRSHREPQWPDWLNEVFSPKGLRMLERSLELAKRMEVERAVRLSTEDFAVAAAGCFRACGRWDLLVDR